MPIGTIAGSGGLDVTFLDVDDGTPKPCWEPCTAGGGGGHRGGGGALYGSPLCELDGGGAGGVSFLSTTFLDGGVSATTG